MSQKVPAAHKVMDTSQIWQADYRLLPSYLRENDNARRIRHYKTAVRQAIEQKLSPTQREYLLLYYDKQLNRAQIAEQFGIERSSVRKTIQSAERVIKTFVELYMAIYDQLERELLNETAE